jgi:hypothetical protein
MAIDRFLPRLTLVALVLLTGGAAGAVAGGLLGWHAPAVLPPDSALTQVTGPGSTVTGRVDGVFGWDPPLAGWRDEIAIWTVGDDGYEAGSVELTRAVPDAPAALRDASAGLAAAGWRTHPIGGDEYGRQFWARRGGVTVEAEIDNVTGDDGVQAGRYESDVRYTFRRAAPDAVRWTTQVGWLAGVLVAAALLVPAARLIRRSRRPSLGRGLAWAGLAALLPATALTTLAAVAAAFPAIDPDQEIPNPPWFALTMFGVHPLAVAGVALLVAAVTTSLVRGARSGP